MPIGLLKYDASGVSTFCTVRNFKGVVKGKPKPEHKNIWVCLNKHWINSTVNHRETTPKSASTLNKSTQKTSFLKICFDFLWQAGENEINTYAQPTLIMFYAYILAVWLQ